MFHYIFKGFDTEESEAVATKKRLLEEQSNVAKANAARLDAETRCHMAERERDMYRLLARRWQSRLNIVLQQQQYSSNSTNQSSTNRINNMSQMENILNTLREEQVIISTLDSLSNNDMEEDEGHFFSMQFANRAFDNNMNNDDSMDDGHHSDDNSDTQNHIQENNQSRNNVSIQMMNDDTNQSQDDQDDNNSFYSDSHSSYRDTQLSIDNQEENEQNNHGNSNINNDTIMMEDIDDNISLSSTLSSTSKQNSVMDIEIRNKQIRTVSMGSTDL